MKIALREGKIVGTQGGEWGLYMNEEVKGWDEVTWNK